MQRAVFLDRDGVLIEDVDALTDIEDIRWLPGVPEALRRLRQAGFVLLVITNQTVVSRGLLSEAELKRIHVEMQRQLRQAGAELDGIYFCPHHPNATVVEYRVNCLCRKPRPGLLFQAAREHHIDLRASFMIGDRMTDIGAGAGAGCRTILIRSGRHLDPPIQGAESIPADLRPDFTCADIVSAVEWIWRAG